MVDPGCDARVPPPSPPASDPSSRRTPRPSPRVRWRGAAPVGGIALHDAVPALGPRSPRRHPGIAARVYRSPSGQAAAGEDRRSAPEMASRAPVAARVDRGGNLRAGTRPALRSRWVASGLVSLAASAGCGRCAATGRIPRQGIRPYGPIRGGGRAGTSVERRSWWSASRGREGQGDRPAQGRRYGYRRSAASGPARRDGGKAVGPAPAEGLDQWGAQDIQPKRTEPRRRATPTPSAAKMITPRVTSTSRRSTTVRLVPSAAVA